MYFVPQEAAVLHPHGTTQHTAAAQFFSFTSSEMMSVMQWYLTPIEGQEGSIIDLDSVPPPASVAQGSHAQVSWEHTRVCLFLLLL